jgi:ketosteroid isomerase-like protein
MRNTLSCCWFAAPLVAGLVLAGCTVPSAPPPAEPAADARAEADAAAIRRTLEVLEQRINRDDIGFVEVFTSDAVVVAPDTPDVVGFDAIRAMYTDALAKMHLAVHFTTEEIVVTGDLAFERGSYTLKVTDKASGQVLQDVTNRHIHMMKRQPDGSWKTWRMMVVAAPAATPGAASASPAPR